MFFVAPAASYTVNGTSYDSSDDNDGLAPERALRTVGRAVTLSTANVGDVIQLIEGTHTVTATVNVSKAGLTFRGSSEGYSEGGNFVPKTVLTSTGTSDELLNITANNTAFLYLTIRPTTAYSAVSWQNAAGANTVDNTYFYRCHFDMYTPAVDISTRGIDLGNRVGGTLQTSRTYTSAAVTHVHVRECTFESDGAQGEAIYLATCSALIEKCQFLITAGTWASPFAVASGSVRAIFKDSDFAAHNGTYGTCISGDMAAAQGALAAYRIYVPATPGADAIRGFGANEIQAAECYVMSAANGTSSVTAISRFTG